MKHNLELRDYIDSNREESPLRQAEDAIVLDNSSMTRDEQFELVLDGEAGARGLILRAADALNNVASARGEAPTTDASGRR